MAELSCSGIFQEVIEEMCDKYCKFPEKYRQMFPDESRAEQELQSCRCDNCPLNRL